MRLRSRLEKLEKSRSSADHIVIIALGITSQAPLIGYSGNGIEITRLNGEDDEALLERARATIKEAAKGARCVVLWEMRADIPLRTACSL